MWRYLLPLLALVSLLGSWLMIEANLTAYNETRLHYVVQGYADQARQAEFQRELADSTPVHLMITPY